MAFEEEQKRQNHFTKLILMDEKLLRSLNITVEHHCTAYFIMGTNEEQEDILLPYMREKHIPYIILNRWVNDHFINYVNVDDAIAAKQAVEYLLSLGHRRIAFIGGNRNYRNSKLRLHGFEVAMGKAQVPVDPQYILQGEYTEQHGYTVGDTIAALPEKPTAALISSDMIAVGLQRRLHELGWKLPDDLSMIGWGDFTIASYVTPALTTIRMPNAEMGTQAAIALNNMIRYPSIIGIHILMNAPLIIRKSCIQIH